MASNNLRVYTPLPREILQANNVSSEQATNFIKSFLQNELSSSSDKSKIVEGLNWKFLLDKNLCKPLKKTKKRRVKKNFLTRKERISLGLLRLPKTGWSNEALEPMRLMWQNYMRQNLDLVKAPSYLEADWTNFSTILAKSELIGAVLTVVQCKDLNQVGISGTVVYETKMTFQIVTEESQFKIIVKESCVFEFRLDNMKFTVFGKHISTRPSERSVKKLKGLLMPEL